MTMHARGQPGPSDRRARLLARCPDLRIWQGDFDEWYADMPEGRMHMHQLDALLGRLEEYLDQIVKAAEEP